MSVTIQLPTSSGGLEAISLLAGPSPAPGSGQWNRIGDAAAHVVCDPLADIDPWIDTSVDWDRTLAYREYLWSIGLGVAEAMDTAQRGMGLSWDTSLELVQRSMEIARGMMGDGVIDLPYFRSLVQAQGFDGLNEVEIFSAENWWKRDPDEVLQEIISRARQC